jgi:hypothetical protein
MNVTVVYESMFGNTRRVAEGIAQGMRDRLGRGRGEIVLRSVQDVALADMVEADLLVVGAPTHSNTLPAPHTRTEASRWIEHEWLGLELEPSALGDGVAEWLERLELLPNRDGLFAAFDTRADLPHRHSGFASHAIAERLRATGRLEAVEPESFLVTSASHSEPRELDRAVTWGHNAALASAALLRSVEIVDAEQGARVG